MRFESKKIDKSVVIDIVKKMRISCRRNCLSSW